MRQRLRHSNQSASSHNGTPNKRAKHRSPEHAEMRETKRKLHREQHLKFNREVLIRLCEAVNTPRSVAVAIIARHDEWSEYMELTFPDPLLESFADDLLVTEFFRKNPTLELNADRKGLALSRFWEAELLCKDTNSRFSNYRKSAPTEFVNERHQIHVVAEIINRSLGPLTSRKLNQAFDSCRFGPGASSSVSGLDVTPSNKYVSTLGHTSRLTPYLPALQWRYSGATQVLLASRVCFVPKTALVDRTICIEPHLNMFLQLGIAKILRDRLTRLGLQPNDQERNRSFCRNALRDGYATIDLSMASDTIAREVVFDLLPVEWFELLFVARTDFTIPPNDPEKYPATGGLFFHELEKWSSMGNGYTWELESLIFYAIARSLTVKPIAVFGDDLIVPLEIVDRLLETLKFFGFKVNMRKSFWQGPFRESCGVDWWHGCDVRAPYITEEFSHGRPHWHYAISVANKIRIYAHNRGGTNYCDYRFKRAWLYAKRHATKCQISYNSYGYGDDGLICNFDEATPEFDRETFVYTARCFVRRPVRSDRTVMSGALAAALHTGSPELSRTEEFVRGRTGRPVLRNVPIKTWYDLGPWL